MKKTIVIAYDMNPLRGTECYVIDLWVKAIAKHYPIDCFVNQKHQKDIDTSQYHNVRFHFIRLPATLITLCERFGLYNLLCFIFFRQIFSRLKGKKNLGSYERIHCLSPLGIHSWNSFYKLGLPVVIGPVIGAVTFPQNFRTAMGYGTIRSFLRDAYYGVLPSVRSWRNYFLNADRILIGTDHIRALIPKEIPQDKIVTVFDAYVDTRTYTPASRPPKKAVQILYVGQLLNHKGSLLLLEAVKRMKSLGTEPFRVVIKGRGPLKKVVEARIQAYGLDHMVTVNSDYLSQKDMLRLYQESDIFCLPALKDSGGLGVLEAMSCGLPVVVSNNGGYRYTVTPHCGFKIEVSDYQMFIRSMAIALKRLINDATLRNAMGKAARERVIDEYSLEALDRNIKNLYPVT